MMDPFREKAVALVRELIEEEESARWSRLGRVPSTFTGRCLDCLMSEPAGRRAMLYDAIASRAPTLLGRQDLLGDPQPLLASFYEEVLSAPTERVAVRLLRGMLASRQSDGPQGPLAQLPEALAARAAAIRPTSAAEIRQAVNLAFGSRFNGTAEKQGAGVWLYHCRFDGCPFSVLIDYGGQIDQLRYSVQVEDRESGLHCRMLSYENLLGLGFGRWDEVTADNLEQSVDLLSDLVGKILTFPRRLADPDVL